MGTMKWMLVMGWTGALLAGCLSLADTASADATDAWRSSYAAETNGNYPGALTALSNVPQANRDAYMWNLRRGWLLYQSGKYGDAAAAYQKAQAAQPASVEATVGSTLPLMALKRWSEVDKACGQVLTKSPGHYLAQSRRAYSRYQMGQYAKAEADYQGLVTLYPGDIEMRAGLGWAQLKQGKSSAAKQVFAAILQVAPDHVSAGQGLAAAQ